MPVHGCASRLRRLKHGIGLPHIIDRAITLIDQHVPECKTAHSTKNVLFTNTWDLPTNVTIC